MPFVILPTNSASGGYDVTNSLRFNRDSSDYLERTPSSTTNQQKFTISTWIKRSALSSSSLYTIYDNTGYSDYISFWFYNDTISYDIASVSPTTSRIILNSASLYRDISAWYHVVLSVDTTQATASNRILIYINNQSVTMSNYILGSGYVTQNSNLGVNSTIPQTIGRRGGGNNDHHFAGYMADYYLIDGQALTPSSFGETDFDTGIWKPKAYTGTYGTNGFYLQFKNSASLGTDSSGNGNTFTVNNLTSIDQTTDTPTNNFCTLNPLNPTSTVVFSNGNLVFSNNSTGHRMSAGTIGVSQGKWYAEVKPDGKGDTYPQVGILDVTQWSETSQPGANSRGWGYLSDGRIFNNNSAIDSGEATYTDLDILMIAMDLDNNKLYFGKNGTWINSGVPTSGATGTGAYSLTSGYVYTFSHSSINGGTYFWNFGNPPFTISSGNADGAGFGNFEYAVPSGYFALCTKNLADYG